MGISHCILTAMVLVSKENLTYGQVLFGYPMQSMYRETTVRLIVDQKADVLTKAEVMRVSQSVRSNCRKISCDVTFTSKMTV